MYLVSSCQWFYLLIRAHTHSIVHTHTLTHTHTQSHTHTQDIVDAGGCPDEGVLANIAQQTLMGLHYLHRGMGVIHRDVK